MTLVERSRIARACGLAQAIAKCRDDARLDGIREGAAEIAELLDLPVTDDRGAVDREAFESIIHDWTCGCGKGKACPNRDGCREAAGQIVARFGGQCPLD